VAQQLLGNARVERFVVGHDYANSRVVLVTIAADNTIRWQQLSLPTSSYLSWSSPQTVTLPSGARPNLVQGNLWLVTCPSGPLMCVGLTYENKVFAFRIGDATAELVSVPGGVDVSRRVGVSDSFPGKNRNELLLVGDDINEKTTLYRALLDASQWPPVLDGSWESWGASGWNRPTFSYGPTTMTAFKMNGSTLYRCWCYKSDLNWGSWWSLGSMSGSASNVDPQAIAWHAAPDQPKADAVFLRQPDGTLLYAYETGSDSTHWYSLKAVPNVTSTVEPVLVPWTNVSLLMVMQSDQVMYSQYWLKEDIFTRLQVATSIQNVETFGGAVIPLDEDGMTVDYLVGFYHKDEGAGIWIDGVKLDGAPRSRAAV
jgi:hypothetical protein